MEIIAHRGASGDAPENTLAAFRLAWAQGAGGIEMDVHLSADGRVMVHHSADTAQTAGQRLVVRDSTSAALRGLDVGAWKGEAYRGERMPFLEEALALVPPGKRALVEVKSGPETVPPLVPILRGVPGGVRLALIAIDLEIARACREAMPQFEAYWVVTAPVGDGAACPPHPLATLERARAAGLAGVDPDHRGITPEYAEAARRAGLKLLTWTVNDPAEALRMAALGLDGITTDWPARMREALAGA